MFEEKLEFRDALILAQQLGFAEADPKLDIDGYDALNKWVILLNHAYGIIEKPSNVVFYWHTKHNRNRCTGSFAEKS